MSAGDFQDYAALWQEQIGEEELEEFRVRAKAIARNTDRRRLIDVALLMLAVGMTAMFLWFNPTPLLTKLGFVPLMAVVVGFVWRRHQIAMAARTIAVDDPRLFFESAIRNARSELNLSRFNLWGGWLMLILTIVLVKTAQGIDVVDWFRRLPRDINFFGITVMALFFLGFVFFLRDHGKIRRQLRRLETMRREWDDQSMR